MSESLLAFHNKPEVKKKYLDRVKRHAKADAIVKGQYWEEGKGCAVGCTIHSSEHDRYEVELGLPTWLAHLEDTIFEGLPNERAMTFPLEFLSSIEIGADVSKVKHKFLHWLLMDEKHGAISRFDHKVYPDVKTALVQVAELHAQCAAGAPWNDEAARSAESAAWSAAWSAARSAARSAAWSAARSAESAARSAAWSAAWSAQADKLLELLRECKGSA